MWTFFFRSFYWIWYNIASVLFLFYVLVSCPRDKYDLSSPSKDQTHTSCTGRQSLNDWTAGKVPKSGCFEYALDKSFHIPDLQFPHNQNKPSCRILSKVRAILALGIYQAGQKKNILRKNPNEAFGQHSTSWREKYLLIEKSWHIPNLKLSSARKGEKKKWLLTCWHKSLAKGTALLIKSQWNKINHLKRIKEFQSKGRWMWEESKRGSFLLWGGWVLTWPRQPAGSLLQGLVTV